MCSLPATRGARTQILRRGCQHQAAEESNSCEKQRGQEERKDELRWTGQLIFHDFGLNTTKSADATHCILVVQIDSNCFEWMEKGDMNAWRLECGIVLRSLTW